MLAQISLKLLPYCNVIIVTAIALEIIVYIRLEIKRFNVLIFYTYLHLRRIKTKKNVINKKSFNINRIYHQ